ncbi:MAG: thiol:disulfide interchange protein DsbA/DsbL, partial [Gammaproteobacteria bacterium]
MMTRQSGNRSAVVPENGWGIGTLNGLKRCVMSSVLVSSVLFSIGCTAEDAVSERTDELSAPVAEDKAVVQDKKASPHAGMDNPLTLAAAETRFEEGKHYEKLKGVPQYIPSEKVQVVEFFSYACPHCYRMESTLSKWHEHMPSTIEFERVPAFWNPYFQMVAQAYYTMHIMQLDDRVHARLFDAIHKQRR